MHTKHFDLGRFSDPSLLILALAVAHMCYNGNRMYK